MPHAKNPAVEFYFEKNPQWQNELSALREIALSCGLAEELKWGVPCYTFQQKNVALLHVFKGYCAVLFPKGILLQDTEKLLTQQTENSQSARQLRFTELQQVQVLAPAVRAYLYEAIEVERAGLTVPLKKTADYAMPEEFQQQLAASPALQAAFAALTPGRQRAYLLHFAQPKQSRTRAARVARCAPAILAGKGLLD